MKAIINEALKIYNGYDWYWYMADYGFQWRHDAAQAIMREYVKVVNKIEDATIREALRALWTLEVQYCRNSVNDMPTENYEGRKAELMNTISLAA